MPTSNAAPLVGRRSPASMYGEHIPADRRAAKLADRVAWQADVAINLVDTHEVIAASAITRPLYADYADELYEDDGYVSPDEWGDGWDEFADLLDSGVPDEDEIDLAGTPITDQDIPGGWGTGLAWEDLQTLTITNRPYLWSTGKETST